MNDTTITARGLVKRYGELTAVAGIDLDVRAGACLGLLGPNGAGKTTTTEMLVGLTRPDAGSITVLGKSWDADARAIREQIGVQLQETIFGDKLTVIEIVQLFRSFYRHGREVDDVIETVGLAPKRTARYHQLSGGQKQRLALGCALVNDPRVLLLDEPTTGLDPQARRRVWEIVDALKAGGASILLTTHFMDEADRLSDELLIIDHGRVIAAGTPRSLIENLGPRTVIEVTVSAAAAGAWQDTLPDGIALPGSLQRSNDTVRMEVAAPEHAVPALLDHLRARDLPLADLRLHRPTLEDVFVALTGRQLRDA
ncbi:MAG: ABC transporter ATP-binding protein [Gammaproteobacteria bacterium]|nr:ABC transporter ATP-binding protein [Gammaproteobacteria bacterium]